MYIDFSLLGMKSLERRDKKKLAQTRYSHMRTKGCVCHKDLIDKKSQWWLFGTIPYPSLTSSGQQSSKYEVDVRLDNYWGDRKSPWRKFHSRYTVI